MIEYLNLMKTVFPHFTEEYLDKPFSEVGIDSIDLVTIRVDFERKIEKSIPDTAWLDFKNFNDIIKYCKEYSDEKTEKDTALNNNIIQKIISINMPQMAIKGLSENWLFKELGKEHWDLLCHGLGTNSSELVDELGNRLYATFVRIRIESQFTLRDFKENEIITLNGTMNRFGGGMYFSVFKFTSSENKEKSIKADLMTSFSSRSSDGNKDLIKSQPITTINSIENLERMPFFGNQYRLVKKQELTNLDLMGYNFKITNNVIFQIEYFLNPYYDLNGVGLLYFASYPIINDFCEAQYTNSKTDINDKWESNYATMARDVLYYANCDINDSIIYKLNTIEELEGKIIKLSSSLYRKSDNILMARIFTIKKQVR